MELNQIRHFLNLAETLNFTKAARRSGVSQPSLTKSIKKLEDELGGLLVYRDGKNTRLTALGRELAVEFMKIDGLVKNARELADVSRIASHRLIRFGIAQTVSPQPFIGFLEKALLQLTSIEVELMTMGPDESEEDLLSGKYDICVFPDPPDPNVKITAHELFEEQLVFAMSCMHDLASYDVVPSAELSHVTYIDRLNCEFRTQLIEHFMDRSVVMRPRLQSDREDWVQWMVEGNLGVCALPERSKIAAGVVLRPVEGLNLARTITMAAVSGSGNPKEVRQILNLARDYEWQHPKEGSQ